MSLALLMVWVLSGSRRVTCARSIPGPVPIQFLAPILILAGFDQDLDAVLKIVLVLFVVLLYRVLQGANMTEHETTIETQPLTPATHKILRGHVSEAGPGPARLPVLVHAPVRAPGLDRDWSERRGQGPGQPVSQTWPKTGRWNAPKCSTYSPAMFLVESLAKPGHVSPCTCPCTTWTSSCRSGARPDLGRAQAREAISARGRGPERGLCRARTQP